MDTMKRETSDKMIEQERSILKAIAENTEAHLAYLDTDFNFVWVNSTYANACRRPAEEFIGRNHFDLFPNEENETIFRRVRDTGEPVKFAAKPFEHPDQPERGTTYWDWTLTPVKDESGNVQGFAFSLTDVTDLKQAEEALQHQLFILQRALLPAKPAIGPGYRLGSAYVPAFAGQEIGGDFYDVFRNEEGKVGILIGDVSGKGIEAASLGAATRNTLRAFAYEMPSPAEALSHANRLIARQQTGHFVTLFLAVLDPATGEFRYSNAGHPPAIVYRRNGDIETLSFGDIPIGFMEKYDYRETPCRLELGDKIILYTDGVTEARHDADLFGLEGIQRVLLENPEEDPEGLVGRILSAAGNWAQGQLADDTAIIVVERTPEQ